MTGSALRNSREPTGVGIHWTSDNGLDLLGTLITLWVVTLTGAVTSLTSHATFYAGYVEYSLRHPTKYIKPVAFLAPLNLLEEFSKPLALSFRLLGKYLSR